MKGHATEDELIAYQLGEGAEHAAIKAHLESCAECAAMAESIAETLRVFSADALPEPNIEHAWQRLRGSLPLWDLSAASSARPAGRRGWYKPLAWLGGAVLAAGLLAGVVELRLHHGAKTDAPVRMAGGSAALPPGPLTAQPRDPQLAAHLENAERLLTEVGHTAGPLDEPTRERAQQLLLTNALYVQRAQHAGDPAEVSVLEELGRTLTTIEHEPATDEKSWHVHLEMTTNGLLLDLRIMQQNDREQNDTATQKDDRQ